MQLTVVGTGFVGVVTAAVFAKLGNTVTGLEIDEKKVASLNEGIVPFFEPGLEELLKASLAGSSLRFTSVYKEAISTAQVVMVVVGTPSSPEGKADTSYVFAAVDELAPLLAPDTVVVIKSTVPPGILPSIRARIAEKTNVIFHLASVPEFLREGTAVTDTMSPDRIVIGAEDEHAATVLSELHKPLGAPIVLTSPESAQLGKYAANSYLALRIGFINQIADLCEKTGADVEEVIDIIGADKRIGSHYWYPGLGYGGSCYPKDVRELAYASRELGLGETLFVKLNELNLERPTAVFEKWSAAVGGWNGKTVAVLGLSFKPNTNDTREAPSLWLIPKLLEAGAIVKGFDPKATPEVEKIIPATQNLSYVDSIATAVENAQVVIALIEWNEIVAFDFASSSTASTQGRWFIDARNQFSPEKVGQWGYTYLGIGRAKANA